VFPKKGGEMKSDKPQKDFLIGFACATKKTPDPILGHLTRAMEIVEMYCSPD
jgi:hypothetical protein